MKNVKIIFKTYKCNVSDYERFMTLRKELKREILKFSINISFKKKQLITIFRQITKLHKNIGLKRTKKKEKCN